VRLAAFYDAYRALKTLVEENKISATIADYLRMGEPTPGYQLVRRTLAGHVDKLSVVESGLLSELDPVLLIDAMSFDADILYELWRKKFPDRPFPVMYTRGKEISFARANAPKGRGAAARARAKRLETV
jgi:hypothetical protein